MLLAKKRKYAPSKFKFKQYKRPKFQRAARKIQRWYKKRKPLYKRWLKSDAKRNTAYGLWLPGSDTQDDVRQQSLQAYRLDMPQSLNFNGATPNGNRTSNEIFVKGIYIDTTIVNHSQTDINIHFAILQDQHANTDASTIRVGFFRDNFNAQETNQYFSDQDLIYKREYDKYKLNTDNRNVILHKTHYMKPANVKKVLYSEPQVLELGVSEAHTIFRFRKYIPLHKYMNFNKPEDITPEKPIFLCFWWVCVDNYGFDQVTAQSNKVCTINTYYQWIYRSL